MSGHLGRVARFLAVMVSVIALGACGSGGDAPDAGADGVSFRLGFLPAERGSDFYSKADTLATYLEQEMGVQVEIFIPTAYEPLIEALRFGNLEASFLDSAPGWIAHQRAGAEVVLAETRADGSTFYWAAGFTRVDSDIESLADLVGKRTAHTSWTGSSGFVMPIGRMVEEGLMQLEGNEFPQLQRAMEQTFASYTMAGGYEAAMQMLVRGQVDAAFGADDAPEQFLAPEDRSQVREFIRFGRVPSHPIVVASHVSPALRDAFVRAMLKLSADRPDIFRELYGVEGVVETTTEEHLGDFGAAIGALPGLHAQFLD